jgi:predicted short-subunit dehydrogenase-like oxidoreductase (DUF2520 family)
MAGVRVKRQDSVRVSIALETRDRLQRVADALGMPPATVASFAIGMFLAQQERALMMQETVVKTMAEKVGGDIGEQLKLMLKEEGKQE